MQENKKILNIILSVLVLSYLISVINAFFAINYEQIISHYYIVGIIAVIILTPAYAFKHYVLGRYKAKSFLDNESVSLWKREFYQIVNPIMSFIRHNMGFFLIVVMISHALALWNIDYKFMTLMNKMDVNLFQGMSIWFVTAPLFLGIWLFSFYILFLSKGKVKHIFPKKIFFFSFFLSSIIFAYNINFLISANLHTEIYAKLYKGVVETDTLIAPCEKKEILCLKVKPEELNDIKKNLMPSLDTEMKYPEVYSSAEFILNRFVGKIHKNSEATTVYYFTSTYSLRYNDEWFSPIMAYNKQTNLLLVDYNSGVKVLKMERHNKISLIAISAIIWICLILLIDMFHDIFLQWRKKKVNQKEEEIRKSNEKDIKEEKVKEENPVKEDGSNNE